MVVPPLTMEDRSDEDFFDKLVDEDDVSGDNGGGKLSFSSSDEQVFENLGIEEVGSSLHNVDRIEGDGNEKSNVVSHDLSDVKGDDIGGGVLELQEGVDVTSIDPGLSESSEVISSISGKDLDLSSGIEEVQGGVFSGGTRKASFSNYFGQIEDDSTDPFAEVVGDSMVASVSLDSNIPSNDADCSTSSYGFGENGGDFHQNSYVESKNETVDPNSIEYWESMYPGWKYDPNTGQWVQTDGVDPNVNNMGISNGNVQSMFDGTTVNPASDINYLHHTTQSAMSGSMAEEGTTGTSMYWNQASYGNTEYPSHMVFDQNYPGWYYDTIAQEWRSLEFYFQSINQSNSLDQSQAFSYQSPSAVNYYPEKNNMDYGQGEQVNSHSYQLMSLGDYEKDASNAMQINKNTQYENSFSYEQSSKSFDSKGLNRFQSFGTDNAQFQNFADTGNTSHLNYGNTLQPKHHSKEFNQQFAPSNFISPNTLNFSQQSHQNSGLSYSSSEGRSIGGRPPHALVSFGFGGKLVVMKHQSSLHTQPAFASQDSAGGVINVFNMMELAMNKSDGSNVGYSDCDYIRALCEQSFPSPLSLGNVGNKDLNKWIDDRIANCDGIQDADERKGEVLKMVLSLLKIACQFYGKLRSPFGAERSSKETDYPESALAKLFLSAKRNTTQFSAVSHCLQNMPSEAQAQATAEEVQKLLVSGRKMEALQCAQQGHLWGPAIVIATLLGDQFYGETVKQMALHQLVAGSPLRTLCLLIAGQPAEVFSNSVASSAQYGVNVSQSSWVGPNCMLDNWEENLAIISTNRTNSDELVITHLGDCLWKERGEVMSAHICYLVAESNIESYSESARLCLVGADHLKYPRTYASPQAIQRTELYEYAKVLGNSQFILLPFQPYKLIYACMLAEVGKLSDSLKYCQAVLKSLKTGRSPEVDTWRNMISSLEERIKIHQQGGYGTTLGGAKLVGKLLNFFDNTAHRVVGGLPPTQPSTLQSNGKHSEHDNQSKGPRVSSSQSTMVMSSLITSPSAEGSDLKPHNRSMSEPNFGRMPRKEESPKASSSSPRDNASTSGGPSRLGRFGSQIFQKTVGLVLRARPDRQAKLGETNKFYYDEKLKRWVEEGAESQPEEMSLAPPPTTSSFINGNLDHARKEEFSNSLVYANGNGESEFKQTISNGKGSELPPIPSTSNLFSARGRMGVRSRYVDTFNKGGQNQVNSFQSPTPSISTMKSPLGNPKFFVPTQVPERAQSPQQSIITDHDSASSNGHNSFSSPQIPTPQRYPSMDKGMGVPGNGNGSQPPNPRRTLSWGGNLDDPNHDIANMSEISLTGPTPGFQ